MSDNNTSGSLFGGLKKLLFKDEFIEQAAPTPVSPPIPDARPAQSQTPPPLPPSATGLSADFGAPVTSNADEQLRTKAYQLLESINKPGVDFMEVWNAAEENGGVTAQNIRSAINALKYADKSLTKEKILTTGNYYFGELQKALDTDLARKAAQRQQLEAEKTQNRQNLSAGITDMEKQIAALQQSLADKKQQLAELDASYEPKMAEIERKMQSGKATITAVLQEMRAMLAIVEKEL
jgi:hypothetical protein